MKYRGYTARIDFDSGDEIFVGRLLGMSDPIIFHGASVEELRGDFEFAVDHYLAECEKMGQKPGETRAGEVTTAATGGCPRGHHGDGRG